MLKLINFEGNCPFEVYFELIKKETSIVLHYSIMGDIAQLSIEEKDNSPNRIIGLWENLCLEFFIKNKTADKYLEFNFSSNHNWNIFTFTSIRSLLTELKTDVPPMLSSTIKNKEFNLEVTLNHNIFQESFNTFTDLIFSPTAILKTKSKQTFHFASSHPDNKLDFHRYESFDQRL